MINWLLLKGNDLKNMVVSMFDNLWNLLLSTFNELWNLVPAILQELFPVIAAGFGIFIFLAIILDDNW